MRMLAQEHYRKGIALRKKGKYYLARKEFLTALELQPHLEALRALNPKTEIPPKNYIIHTVKPGESLSMIAKTYYGNYKKFPIIAQFNNMSDATRIKVGQKIKVPTIEEMKFLVTIRTVKIARTISRKVAKSTWKPITTEVFRTLENNNCPKRLGNGNWFVPLILTTKM
jgi:LysM repeat protein